MTRFTHSLATLAGVASVAMTGCHGVLGPVENAQVVPWQATLQPAPGAIDAPTGSAAALSRSGRTSASIGIEGMPNASYHWRYRRGTCDSPGSIIGLESAYRLLETDEDGRVEADVSLDEAMPEGNSYNAAVFDAAGEAVLACGEFGRI